ncbi:nucleoside phosphorylase domain-containing protein [Thamnocephalis sphaerospora]|uniref:Purine nucleoside phosphorylase n=1 Tax=Thamnocephalis sphaerospora TaxID=78915 RepID=A0A4P9XZV4_9FUNG|nr:nucleoside phosphorylase domain-containing protein [Thamnocephalis sphaerospora]|eukprot:RKP11020.1 nucleoside phosphorylase domain-containing protein [Thamnocephalis sphaerospora]
MSKSFVAVSGAVEYIRANLPEHAVPTIGIVCGSGLGGLGARLSDTTTFDYASIPGFATSSVVGHAGKLVFGEYGGKRVVCMVGRLHYYEGHDLPATAFPIRVMHQLGVKTLLLTNAAGGLNPAWNAGDLVLIYDHLSLPSMVGQSALRGPNADEFGPRFPALGEAYPVELRRLAVEAAKEAEVPSEWLHEGIYAFVGGPSYETPAESRAIRMLGADAIGMSTVPEVITAVHCGIKVLAVSLLTNRVPTERGQLVLPQDPAQKAADALEATGIDMPTHEEVLAMSAERSALVEQWFEVILQKL